MTGIDLIALRQKAERATPGPWYLMGVHATKNGYRRAWGISALDDETDVFNTVCPEFDGSDPNAEFIATANPAVVLQLLDTIDKQRLALSRGWNLTQYEYANAYDEWAENAGDGTADGRWPG